MRAIRQMKTIMELLAELTMKTNNGKRAKARLKPDISV